MKGVKRQETLSRWHHDSQRSNKFIGGQPAAVRQNMAHENKEKFLKYQTLHRNKDHFDFDDGRWEV